MLNIQPIIHEVQTKNLGKVKIRVLTLKEVIESEIQNKGKDGQVNETLQMFDMLSKAIVEPEVTLQDLQNLPITYLSDLTELVSYATGNIQEEE